MYLKKKSGFIKCKSKNMGQYSLPQYLIATNLMTIKYLYLTACLKTIIKVELCL